MNQRLKSDLLYLEFKVSQSVKDTPIICISSAPTHEGARCVTRVKTQNRTRRVETDARQVVRFLSGADPKKKIQQIAAICPTAELYRQVIVEETHGPYGSCKKLSFVEEAHGPHGSCRRLRSDSQVGGA